MRKIILSKDKDTTTNLKREKLKENYHYYLKASIMVWSPQTTKLLKTELPTTAETQEILN